MPAVIGWGDGDAWSMRLESEGREYETFFEGVSQALSLREISWDQVDRIFLVCGPAGFSATRVTTLMISTLRYVYPHIAFYSLDRFTLAHHLGAPYPLIIDANRAEYLVAHGPHDYQLTPKDSTFSGGYDILRDPEGYITADRLIALAQRDPDVLLPICERVVYFRPMYLKKPHITLPTPPSVSL